MHTVSWNNNESVINDRLHQESSSLEIKQQILGRLENAFRDIQLFFGTDNRGFGFAGITNTPSFGIGMYIFSSINIKAGVHTRRTCVRWLK